MKKSIPGFGNSGLIEGKIDAGKGKPSKQPSQPVTSGANGKQGFKGVGDGFKPSKV